MQSNYAGSGFSINPAKNSVTHASWSAPITLQGTYVSSMTVNGYIYVCWQRTGLYASRISQMGAVTTVDQSDDHQCLPVYTCPLHNVSCTEDGHFCLRSGTLPPAKPPYIYHWSPRPGKFAHIVGHIVYIGNYMTSDVKETIAVFNYRQLAKWNILIHGIDHIYDPVWRSPTLAATGILKNSMPTLRIVPNYKSIRIVQTTPTDYVLNSPKFACGESNKRVTTFAGAADNGRHQTILHLNYLPWLATILVDPTTLFSQLPRDITGLIDQYVHDDYVRVTIRKPHSAGTPADYININDVY